MKSVFLFVTLFAMNPVFAMPLWGYYSCIYTAERAGKPPFVMAGMIDPYNIPEGNHATYLTLQPPSVTGIPYDARILFTIWDYNPITIHPRGDTVGAVALSKLQPMGGSASFTGPDGSKYSVECTRR